MTEQKPRNDTRETILDAAEKVVAESGARRLTIDAVVERSGISKGGVLYHFPNKSALLDGMVFRMVQSFEEKLAMAEDTARAAGEPVQPHIARAMSVKNDHQKQVAQALLAAISEEPARLEPAHRLLREVDQRFIDGSSDPVMSQIIMLALDGLHHRALLGFDVFTPDIRDAIRERLIDMTWTLHS
ncbi:TetR/AcrR family transcriptional regulator [Hyphobacterium marinum]|uniref:TetR/AcrR family transcriptional regulator n=1 Tax=Hyphobacterium marinum TaxID=3116574 RepID=A0ABU7LYW6_9PROT|nr:TetR/AcrR family transcriptional regulator [Hyphobacterium sp. Y6023]MEE2566751.1 TetR/AcrR family transcriptional regulator [Hyphobacterium sp. Y6023]